MGEHTGTLSFTELNKWVCALCASVAELRPGQFEDIFSESTQPVVMLLLLMILGGKKVDIKNKLFDDGINHLIKLSLKSMEWKTAEAIYTRLLVEDFIDHYPNLIQLLISNSGAEIRRGAERTNVMFKECVVSFISAGSNISSLKQVSGLHQVELESRRKANSVYVKCYASDVCMIAERVIRGTLEDKAMNPMQAVQALQGIKNLIRGEHYHGDLVLQNVLLVDDDRLCFIDFSQRSPMTPPIAVSEERADQAGKIQLDFYGHLWLVSLICRNVMDAYPDDQVKSLPDNVKTMFALLKAIDQSKTTKGWNLHDMHWLVVTILGCNPPYLPNLPNKDQYINKMNAFIDSQIRFMLQQVVRGLMNGSLTEDELNEITQERCAKLFLPKMIVMSLGGDPKEKRQLVAKVIGALNSIRRNRQRVDQAVMKRADKPVVKSKQKSPQMTRQLLWNDSVRRMTLTEYSGLFPGSGGVASINSAHLATALSVCMK